MAKAPEVRSSLSARSSRIYLTGFMGSGKSTIGPILANTIGYAFVDTDKELERRTGTTIRKIFRKEGENYFRALERRLIAELSLTPRVVISVGGGTMLDPDNLRIMSATGIVIYLKSTPDHLFKRLHNKTDRPVLADVNGERLSEQQLRARIEELYAARDPIYSQADFNMPTDEQRVGLTVDEIVRRLKRYVT
jgi:shikimate kinase